MTQFLRKVRQEVLEIVRVQVNVDWRVSVAVTDGGCSRASLP